MHEKFFPGYRLKISYQTPLLVLFLALFGFLFSPSVTHNSLVSLIQSIWVFLCQLTCYALLVKTCCHIINIKFSANICCTRGPRGNHVSKVYFIVKKKKMLQTHCSKIKLIWYCCIVFAAFFSCRNWNYCSV